MARSEQKVIGAPDKEALFASQEGAKWPTVLAAGARHYLKAEAARSESLPRKRPKWVSFFIQITLPL